jgi:hypothetical protein
MIQVAKIRRKNLSPTPPPRGRGLNNVCFCKSPSLLGEGDLGGEEYEKNSYFYILLNKKIS